MGFIQGCGRRHMGKTAATTLRVVWQIPQKNKSNGAISQPDSGRGVWERSLKK
jgi:hypothetical protein